MVVIHQNINMFRHLGGFASMRHIRDVPRVFEERQQLFQHIAVCPVIWQIVFQVPQAFVGLFVFFEGNVNYTNTFESGWASRKARFSVVLLNVICFAACTKSNAPLMLSSYTGNCHSVSSGQAK